MMSEKLLSPEDKMKLLFPHRPWENEPDTAEWYDAATGYKCRIERNHTTGTLCGYVGVFKGHPLHKVGYNDAEWESLIDTHGGLTYSNTDMHEVHWFGFDTAHAGDFCPGITLAMLRHAPESDTKSRWMQGATGILGNETYRTWEYVEDEVHKLVNELWTIDRNSRERGEP